MFCLFWLGLLLVYFPLFFLDQWFLLALTLLFIWPFVISCSFDLLSWSFSVIFFS